MTRRFYTSGQRSSLRSFRRTRADSLLICGPSSWESLLCHRVATSDSRGLGVVTQSVVTTPASREGLCAVGTSPLVLCGTSHSPDT